MLSCPNEYCVFLEQVCQWFTDDAEMFDKLAVVPASPKKLRNSLALAGTSHCAIAETLAGSVATPCSLTTCPKYLISH